MINFLIENLDQIILILVSIITSILGYIVGRKHQLFIEKRSRLIERYQKLYAPFEKQYLKTCVGAFYFSDLPSEEKKLFLTILYDNYEYTDSKLKNLIYEFNSAYRGSNIDIEASNLKFHEIACHISYEFNKIGKKLFFEPYNINA